MKVDPCRVSVVINTVCILINMAVWMQVVRLRRKLRRREAKQHPAFEAQL